MITTLIIIATIWILGIIALSLNAWFFGGMWDSGKQLSSTMNITFWPIYLIYRFVKGD